MTRELLLKESRSKFLGRSILGLPGSHYWRILILLEKYFSITITEPSGLSSAQSIRCFTITDIAEGCAQGSAKKPNSSSINTLFAESWNKKRMQYTDRLLSSKKDICQEPSMSFVLLHFLFSHLHHTSCYDSYVTIIWRENVTEASFFSISSPFSFLKI